jgi:hypothetical protein
VPFDWVEGTTTGLADAIVVNSRFTRGVFREAFPGIEKVPDVIYPSVDIHAQAEDIPEDNPLVEFLKYTPFRCFIYLILLELGVSFYQSIDMRSRRIYPSHWNPMQLYQTMSEQRLHPY